MLSAFVAYQQRYFINFGTEMKLQGSEYKQKFVDETSEVDRKDLNEKAKF